MALLINAWLAEVKVLGLSMAGDGRGLKVLYRGCFVVVVEEGWCPLRFMDQRFLLEFGYLYSEVAERLFLRAGMIQENLSEVYWHNCEITGCQGDVASKNVM